MRENRPYGSEGGESGSTGLPYPYPLYARPLPSCLCVLLPLRLCAFASLRLFLYDSRNEVSLMRGPTGNSHQRSPPCGSEQEALSSAAPASAAPRDAYP